MKRKILYSLGTLVVGALTIAAVANGPYYAFPAWAQKLVCATTSNCPRFIVLADWNSEAVLDRETGLVWQRSPSTPPSGPVNWFAANGVCVQATTGNRLGWRLPTINEIASIFDPSVITAPQLPQGHPFTSLPLADIPRLFWTVTPNPADGGSISHRVIGYDTTRLPTLNAASPNLAQNNVWCVRGGLFPGPQ